MIEPELMTKMADSILIGREELRQWFAGLKNE